MIVILGGDGYIGSALTRHFRSHGEQVIPLSRSRIDYTNRDLLIGVLRDLNPVFLINAAGYSGKPNVDACEDNRAECLAANAVLPGIVHEACEACKLPWGHISSGCIYSGRRDDGKGFTEVDPPNFSFRSNRCSFYSGCKALGEEILRDAERLYIWRIRIPFSPQNEPRNYLTKLLTYSKLLDAENSLTNLDEFSRVCLQFHRRKDLPYGIYNATNTGSITTREVTSLLRRISSRDHRFRFFKDEAEFMEKAARTPRSNCVLDNSKLRDTGIPIREVKESVRDAIENWR